jgi:hypothetical protein
MKLIFVAAALMVGGTAIAQERDARGIPVVSETPNVPPGANQPLQPGAGPVVPAPNQAEVFQTRPATAAYPPCTRGQTDRCTQTYERGRAPR